MHGDGGSLTRTSSERLTSLLTVAGDLPKRRSAQRWAGPYSHGGSQRAVRPPVETREPMGGAPPIGDDDHDESVTPGSKSMGRGLLV